MEYILQEIFARLTIYNFCERIITTIAIQQKNRKYTYQTNFTVAVFICREYFRDRIHPSDLVALIRKNILPIREGRKAEYSCAVTPQVRQTGNRLSGLAGTAYASLLT